MPKKKFSDELRTALLKCGESRYSISQRTGLSQSLLSKFVRGATSLSMESIDVLVEAIGARLTVVPPIKKKTSKKTTKTASKERK